MINRTEIGRIESLADQYTRGLFSKMGKGPQRRVVFDNGEIWFPAGKDRASSAGGCAIQALGIPTILSLMATIVCFADGLVYGWIFLGLLVLCGAGLWIVSGNEKKKDEAAIARLQVGLFLLPDSLVLRDGVSDWVIPRDEVDEFKIVFARRGGNKARDWVHVIRRGENIPTDLLLNVDVQATLTHWHGGGASRSE